MREKIDSYIKQFNDIFNGEPWLDVTFDSAMKNADEKSALAKPLKNVHSAAEIICHVIAYREFLTAQFEGKEDLDIDQEKSFETEKYKTENENLWVSIMRAFGENHKKLIGLMNKSDDETLKKKVYNRNYELKFLMDGIIQHDAYHLGQIIIILKNQN